MSKIIPDPKAPNESTDYIYGERMEPFSDRMNFFQNEKVEVNKDDVKEEDKAAVDGLESIFKRFSEYGNISLPNSIEIATESGVLAGVEGSDQPIPWTKWFILMAKEAVDFILNFINNRIARIDNRAYRIGLNRKREGIKTVSVNYPAGIRRLIIPTSVSTDPSWVGSSVDKLREFYKQSMSAYKLLVANIKTAGSDNFDLNDAVYRTIKDVANAFNMKAQGETYGTDILPGNRRLLLNEVSDGGIGNIGIYFTASGTETKLRSKDFVPTSHVIDGTLRSIDSSIKEIRSNQSTISQLYRTFEREVANFENINNLKLGADARGYLGWLIRFNKKLMNLVLIYVINGLDAGLDFCKVSIRDGD